MKRNSKTRQELAKVLEQADSTGKVLIRRKDGRAYALIPEKNSQSPLDIPSIESNLTTPEIVSLIREARERILR